MQTLQNSELSDDEKEHLIQSNSLAMFKLLGVLLGGMALSLLVPLIVVWVLDQVGLLSLSEVLGTLARIDVIVIVSVVGIFIYWISSKWHAKTT